VARRCQTLRQKRRAFASRLGKTYRSQSGGSAFSDRKIRYRHADSQRDFNRSDESAWRNLLYSRKISRRSARRRYGLVIFRGKDRNGRARYRRDAYRRAKSPRAPARFFVVLCVREGFRPRRKNSTSRILF